MKHLAFALILAAGASAQAVNAPTAGLSNGGAGTLTPSLSVVGSDATGASYQSIGPTYTTPAVVGGANSSSPFWGYIGSYDNGTAAADDNWRCRNVLGTGANPATTLTCTHVGSTGLQGLTFPVTTNFTIGGLTTPPESVAGASSVVYSAQRSDHYSNLATSIGSATMSATPAAGHIDVFHFFTSSSGTASAALPSLFYGTQPVAVSANYVSSQAFQYEANVISSLPVGPLMTTGNAAIGGAPQGYLAATTSVNMITVGAAVASASTIAPMAGVVHVTGTAAIATITPPPGMGPLVGGCIALIADAAWSMNTTGNIAAAVSATANTAYQACYDGVKWYVK